MSLSRLDTNKAVALHTAATSLPWPTTDEEGAAIAAMGPYDYFPDDVWLRIDNTDDASVTLENITLVVHYAAGETTWASAGLVTPDAVTIPAGQSVFVQAPIGAAALGDRWAVYATVNGTSPHVTVTAIPLSQMGS